MKKGTKQILAYVFFALIFSIVSLLMIFLSSAFTKSTESTDISKEKYGDNSGYPTVIIDAGHGGEDGGAVGINGIYEKELNLIIAADLCDMLRSNGVNVIMTRENDVMLYDKSADYKGRKKLLDLAERLRIGENCEDSVFVSIHMNSFPQEKYSGFQVYYSANNQGSQILAENIQTAVCESIQKNNGRSIKKADGNIYLLDRLSSPAVLIECGFISNSEECALLCTEEYRQKLTLSIFCGIMESIS
ncbi:MAG: N-acetylmuramoyl-L-alanine amidase [Clostridia bacterium]|nr:N-acetylmuramoyl-L-alanine amidase [Clostridia bacterium]